MGPEAALERLPREDDEREAIQGGRERGLILHKLLEEVLTREIDDDVARSKHEPPNSSRNLGLQMPRSAATGLSSGEMASTVHRALQLPDVAALRPRLQPEFRVYAGVQADQTNVSYRWYRRRGRFRRKGTRRGGHRLEERCRSHARPDRNLSGASTRLPSGDRSAGRACRSSNL